MSKDMKSYSKQFATEVEAVYKNLAKDYWHIGRGSDGNPCLPEDDKVLKQLIRSAIARCGAGVGAALKRAKRQLLLDKLVEIRDSGVDITPAVAQGTANRLLGRGISAKETARLFSTKGRTAADKSTITSSDLEQIENKLSENLSILIKALNKKKESAHTLWALSPERKKIMKDWSIQRKNLTVFP